MNPRVGRKSVSGWKAVTALVVGCLFLAMAAAPPASAATSYLSQWGSNGAGDGQLSFPGGLGVNATDDVYVADSGNARIQMFDSDGSFLLKWGTAGVGNGQFDNPIGVGTDPSGNVYVADSGNERVQKFTSTGVFLTQWGTFGVGNGQFDGPTGIAVDSSGNVYVADTGNDRIQKFDSNGTFLTEWGTTGAADGQFDGPVGLAADSLGNIYANDSANFRVQKFNSNGVFLAKWGSNGAGDGQFSDLTGIAADPLGNVYVADPALNRVQQFDSAGTFLDKFGSTGSGNSQFQGPNGVGTDSQGNVYVVENGNSRVQKFGEPVVGPPSVDPPSTDPPSVDPQAGVPPPVLAKKVNLAPVKGKVRTKCRGEKKFTRLTAADQIPVGCLVDTRNGVVRLTSSKGKAGGTQSANFWKGLFKVTQKAGKRPFTELALAGPLNCGKPKSRSLGLRIAPTWTAAVAAAERASVSKRARGRKLWGKGKGRFKTKGRYGSASVRGTQWLTEDRCNKSTFFKVKSGVVKVRDFARKKTVTVKKGGRYVAGAQG